MSFASSSFLETIHTNNFEEKAIAVFQYQYENILIYRAFVEQIGVNVSSVKRIQDIPFLPISFFKSHQVCPENIVAEIVFSSSGTTGMQTSKHFVKDIAIYEHSFNQGFEHFYGNISDYCFLALLPSYLERTGSSLIYMCDALIRASKHPDSGFYLYDLEGLAKTLNRLDKQGQKTILIGVSYALLDLLEVYSFQLKNTIVMETGGMKGKRKEMIKEAFYQHLKKGFGVTDIHSEYGMTELLSQAYSLGGGKYYCPNWMRVLVRDTNDPFCLLREGKSGGLNIIDLANINSCSFIATQDLGVLNADGSFSVLGRFDHSDIRGCNLMVE